MTEKKVFIKTIYLNLYSTCNVQYILIMKTMRQQNMKKLPMSLEKAINKTRLRFVGNIRDCNIIMINILWFNVKGFISNDFKIIVNCSML